MGEVAAGFVPMPLAESGEPADRFRCGRIAATPGAGGYRARVQTREPTTLRPGASTARESALIG